VLAGIFSERVILAALWVGAAPEDEADHHQFSELLDPMDSAIERPFTPKSSAAALMLPPCSTAAERLS
jgi:hypothetical protein